MKIVQNITMAIIFFLIITLTVYGKFYLWRVKHPNAPTWSYFF